MKEELFKDIIEGDNVTKLKNEVCDALKKMEKDGELTEDELKKAQDEVQKITDKFIKEVDQVATAKEKDIMEV